MYNFFLQHLYKRTESECNEYLTGKLIFADKGYDSDNFVRWIKEHSGFPGKSETLAEYYVCAHEHLLGDVSVFEILDEIYQGDQKRKTSKPSSRKRI